MYNRHVGNLVPKVKHTARILYIIYLGLSLIEFIVLIAAKMPVFDAMNTTFGTAGTGGFGIKNTSLGGYSVTIQWIVTIFMMLFGVNFNAYYIMIFGSIKTVSYTHLDVYKRQGFVYIDYLF